jgi:O-antigen ligase
MAEPTEPHLHDNFLQVCAQNGWIGLAAYLFWVFSYYWTALRSHTSDKDSKDLNWALLCVFSAVLVWGLTEYTFSHQFMNVQFFLLGLQIGLWRNPSQKQA